MKAKWIGGAFLAMGLISFAAFALKVWPIFTTEVPVLTILIPALKYWAFSELASGIGIVFLFVAPAREWTWREFFSLEWRRAAWLTPGFRILLLGALVFLATTILIDFGYRLALAANIL